jgi:hypothetical protein
MTTFSPQGAELLKAALEPRLKIQNIAVEKQKAANWNISMAAGW